MSAEILEDAFNNNNQKGKIEPRSALLSDSNKSTYQWQIIDNINKNIIVRCFEIANDKMNKDTRVPALHLALESYLQIAKMINKEIKLQYPDKLDTLSTFEQVDSNSKNEGSKFVYDKQSRVLY